MSTATSSLVIEIDSRHAQKFIDDLRKGLKELQEQGNRTSQGADRTGRNITELGGQITVVNRITNNYNNTNNTTNNRLTTLNRTINNTNNNLNQLAGAQDRAARSTNGHGDAIKRLIVTAASYLTLSKAMNAADEYTNLNNSLKLVTTSQTSLTLAIEDTYKIAQATASEWNAVNSVFSKYMANAKTLNLTQAESTRLTEITSKAVAISGSTTQAAAGALFQYGQSLDQNILRSQEYNSLVDGAGGLLNAMAKGLNVTRGELRQMMLDGKLTGEVITQSLLKAGDSVDELFAKTDTTIRGGLQTISNAFTKAVGEFDKGTGSSRALVNVLTNVAENFESIISIIGVAAWAGFTKMIMTQVSAMKASVVAAQVRRATTIAELQAQVQLSGVEAMRARQQVGALAAEQNLLTTRIRQTSNLQQRVVLEARAAQVAIQLAVAERQATAATAAYTAAQNAASVATNRLASARAMLTAVTGGWLGLGVMVASVGAGYLLMNRNAQEATTSLDVQSEKVEDLVKLYKELNTLQLDNEIKALSDQVEDLSAKYAAASSDLGAFISGLPISDKNIATYEKLEKQFRKGQISGNAFYEGVKSGNILTDKQLEKLRALIDSFDKNQTAINKATKAQAELAKVVGDSAKEQDNFNQKMSESEKAIKSATQAYSDYLLGFTDQKRAAVFDNSMLTRFGDKYSESQRKVMAEWAKMYNYDRNQLLTEVAKKDLNNRLELLKIQEQSGKIQDGINKKEEERTKELEKQAKLIKASTIDAVISRGEGNYNSFNRGKAGDSMGRSMTLTNKSIGEIMAMQSSKEIFAAGKYQITPNTLKGAVDALGLSKKMMFSPENQEKIFKEYLVSIARPEIKGFIQGKNPLNEALLGVSKEFASVANPATGRSYYDGKANNKASISVQEMTDSLLAQQKIYRENIALGMTSEEAWLKSFNSQAEVTKASAIDVDKFLEGIDGLISKQAENRKKIIYDLSDYETRIRSDLADRLEQIDKAGFDPQETAKFRAQAEQRANAEISIQNEKFNSFADFLKTEDQLLIESYARRQFEAKNDFDLTASQRVRAVILLQQQLAKQENALKLARDKRILDAKSVYMTESELLTERYRIEQSEISNIKNEFERMALLRSKNLDFIRGGVGFDKNLYGGQFLQSIEFMPSSKTNLDFLDEDYDKQLTQMQARFNQMKELNIGNNAELLQIEKDHLSAKEQLQNEYIAKIGIARRSDYENQLAVYSQMASSTSSVFSQMESIVSQVKDENTKTYKTIFALNKAAAIAQAIINTEEGATKALAQGGAYGAVLAGVVRATGYASVGIMASQAIGGPGGNGYADGGYTGDGYKYTPAGVVHKGEVVWSQEDIKHWGGVENVEAMRKSRSKGYSSGGIVNEMRTVNAIQAQSTKDNERENIDVKVNVTVNADGSSKTDVQGDSKQLGELMGNAIRKVIMQEQRQGGLLAR